MAESTDRTAFSCVVFPDGAQLLHVHLIKCVAFALIKSESTGFRQSPYISNPYSNLVVLILLRVQYLTVIPSQQQQAPSAFDVWWSRVGPGSCDLQVVPASRRYWSAGNWLRGWPFGIQPAVSWQHSCSDCLLERTTRLAMQSISIFTVVFLIACTILCHQVIE